MIPGGYRAACLVLVRRLRSGLRGILPLAAAAADGRPADPPVPDLMPGAVATAAVAPTATSGQDLAQVVSHLRHFGYEVETDPGHWNEARHPNRYDFQFRVHAHGIGLHCAIGIGASAGNSRAAWLDLLNRANERSRLARFSLFEGSNGRCQIWTRALFSGSYSLPVFAMLMDMWHEDLDMLARMAEALSDDPAREDDADAAPTVH